MIRKDHAIGGYHVRLELDDDGFLMVGGRKIDGKNDLVDEDFYWVGLLCEVLDEAGQLD